MIKSIIAVSIFWIVDKSCSFSVLVRFELLKSPPISLRSFKSLAIWLIFVPRFLKTCKACFVISCLLWVSSFDFISKLHQCKPLIAESFTISLILRFLSLASLSKSEKFISSRFIVMRLYCFHFLFHHSFLYDALFSKFIKIVFSNF